MKHPFYQWLHQKEWLLPQTLQRWEKEEATSPFPLLREVSFLLYAGIMVFMAGMGILVYEHISQIGHVLLLLGIFVSSIGGLWVAHHRYPAWSFTKISPPGLWYPYLVLGSALLFVCGEGYLEYVFDTFQDNYRVPGILTAGLLLFLAYRFDHEQLLSLGISTFAASIGLLALPNQNSLEWLGSFTANLATTAIIFGIFLLISGRLLAFKKVKVHFESAYAATGATILFVSVLYLQARASNPYWYFLLVLALTFSLFRYARSLKSVYLYMLDVLCGFIGLIIFLVLISNESILFFFLYFGWVLFAFMVVLLIKYKKILEIE